MSIEPRRSQELANLALRFRMAAGSDAPTLSDIQRMFKKSKEARGCIIEWSWTDQAAAKSYTLVGIYPNIKDSEWWNYEIRDDPTWTLSEDRAQGNPTIWEYKTSDLQLVLEIVQMVGSRNLKVIGQAAFAELYGLTPVFQESLTDQYQVLQSGFNPGGLQDICAVLRSLGPSYFNGRVQISSHCEIGQIFFAGGAPTHAFVAGVSGDVALAEIISWQVGTVAYAKDERIEITSLSKHLESLIQDGFFLLEQKRYLARSGLAYESYLSQINVGETNVRATLNDWQRRLYDRIDGRSSLVDILRDLHQESTEWVPLLVHLLGQRLVQIESPRPQRATALHFLDTTKHNIDEQLSQLLSPQTGMYKHHALLLFAQREMYALRRHKSPLSLIVFEMQLPEGRGNRPRWLSTENVKQVARKVELLKRPVDVYAHFESLDYALLLPNTDLKQATIVAKTLLKILAQSPLSAEDPVQLSLACGVASLPEHGHKLARLFAAAKFAKKQAKMWRLPLVVAANEEESDNLPNPDSAGSSPAGAQHRPSPTAEHQIETDTNREAAAVTFQFSDLLIRAGLISPDHHQQACELISRMPVRLPVGRVLAMEGHIQERTVRCAEEIQSLIENKVLSVEQGIRALQLVGDHGLDLDTVLKRMGRPRIAEKTNMLGELLHKAGIIDGAALDEGLRQSAMTSMPLASVLLSSGLVYRSLLLDGLTAQACLARGHVTAEEAIAALEAAKGKKGSFRQCLAARNGTGTSDDAHFHEALEELLSLAGLLSPLERIVAREVALAREEELQSTLVQCGFASEACLELTRQLLGKIENSSLTQKQAAQILRKSKRDNFVVDTEKPVEDLLKAQPGEKNESVDLIELLRSARFISERQWRGGQALSAAKNIPLLTTLLDAGVVDRPTVDLVAVVKEMIDTDKLDLEQAMMLLRYCQQEKASVERVLHLFGWS